ncbi:nuclear factor interleukin-3-regulated protein-like [Archocentrus centrarchus]|uniref:nuclear factor interleukin-3-regulated protein-like n=1 Tax=Archocentrus centrarchus TaxID=63155 RepID=UPI0011EA027D|nr:nuclear factor interleukin-3-regulated protein-like [Archocentrus centrarchus]
MTGQTVGGIIQDLTVPSLLRVGSRPQGENDSFTEEAVSILTSTSQLARSLLGHTFAFKRKDSLSNAEAMGSNSCDEENGNNARRKREFIPSEKKDEGYWDKRKKNNEAARRSREKRRVNDMVLERRVMGLLEENARLRAELLALKFRFGLVKDPSNVSILPLTAPLCPHPPPRIKNHYQAHTDGPPYVSTQPTASTHQISSQPPQHGAVYGARTVELSHSASQETGVATSCGSNVGSPVFFDDTLGECGRPSPREVADEQQCCESHYVNRQDSPEGLRSLPHKLRFKGPGGSNNGGEMSASPDSRHSGLPIAMVGPNIQMRNHQQVGWDGQIESQASWSREDAWGGQYQGSSSGYYNSSFLQNSSENRYPAEDSSLRSQISSLSQEVAQLKRLLSQQLLPKMA